MKTIKTTATTSAIKVATGVKAGGLNPAFNHSVRAIRVKTSIKAGTMICLKNHSTRLR